MITSEQLEATLWAGADDLRGSMDASRYKDYMLGHEWSPSNSDAIHFIIGKVFEFNEKQKKNGR